MSFEFPSVTAESQAAAADVQALETAQSIASLRPQEQAERLGMIIDRLPPEARLAIPGILAARSSELMQDGGDNASQGLALTRALITAGSDAQQQARRFFKQARVTPTY